MKTIKKLFMNRIIFVIVTLLSVGFGLASCNKDTTEEEILKNQLATADSLLKRGGVIKYTVKIVSTANSSILKSKMSIENANVTIYQNDKVYTAITDANGFAIFPDMRIGTAAVNVKLKDHAEVDYIADLTPADNLINLSQGQMVNTVRYASTMVPMFPIAAPGAATITGKVTAELDLTNTVPEPAPNVTVTAKVDVDDPDFVSRYITPTQGTTNSNAGRIIKYAFQDAIISTQTDAQGNYTLQVPAALNGLPIKLSVADYQTNQKLYLENDPADGTFKPGKYEVNCIFSKCYKPSPIPLSNPLYVKFEEPNCPLGKILAPTTFKHTVDAQGSITDVQIINKGIFTNKPAIVALNNGTGAILDPVFNNNTGEIESIVIVNGGKNYKSDGQGTVIRAYLTTEYKKPKLDFVINDGYLSKIKIIDPGLGYVYSPSFKLYTPSPNSTLPDISINVTPQLMQISSITINLPGKNLINCNNYPLESKNIVYNDRINLSSSQLVIQNIELGTGIR